MTNKTISYILIMSLVTYATRTLPIILMNRQIESKFIKSFLYFVPFAVLSSMTFPSILYSTGNIITGLIGLIIGVLLSSFNSGLMTVATFTVLVVYTLSFFNL